MGSDTVTLSGSGSILSASVGSKGVTIGSLQSAHPNYTLNNATITVTQKPVNLFGSRIGGAGGGYDIPASELRFTNLASGETLESFWVWDNTKSCSHNTSNDVKYINNEQWNRSISNYTFTGGSFLFEITSPSGQGLEFYEHYNQ